MKKNNTFSLLLTLSFLLMVGSPSLLAADAAAGKKQFIRLLAERRLQSRGLNILVD